MSDVTITSVLKKIVVPFLREHGFKGQFPRFHRVGDGQVDLVYFQFSKYGGSFIVELGTAPSGDFTTSWGEIVPLAKIEPSYLGDAHRHRLGGRGSKAWFRYAVNDNPSAEDLEKVAAQVIKRYETEGEDWLRHRVQASILNKVKGYFSRTGGR